jgi:SAM-dependent methyltransferase
MRHELILKSTTTKYNRNLLVMKYLNLCDKYRAWLEEKGDTPEGVGWTQPNQAPIRYKVMLEVIKKYPTSILDFGCGTAALLDYIKILGVRDIVYYGIDILPESISIATKKHPEAKIVCADIIRNDELLQGCPAEYAIINGLFTYKYNSSFEEMWEFLQVIMGKLFHHASKGLAINLMSKAVDWERDDLFHMPVGTITDFITKNLTRHYVIRHDYKLYEYTIYLYK